VFPTQVASSGGAAGRGTHFARMTQKDWRSVVFIGLFNWERVADTGLDQFPDLRPEVAKVPATQRTPL